MRRRLLWAITLSFPLWLVLVCELVLRLINYGGNLDLFVAGPPGYEGYLRPNMNVARRYFYVQSDPPTPPIQLFLKEKPANGYRIVVLGESSTAGFPYGNNAAFPNVLQRGLAHAFPGKRIEVINIAMSAINTFALRDLLGEVLDQSPDALLIYTGHNEYYGAMGVGSVVSLGNARWLVNAFLKLQRFKTFLFLRNVIAWTKNGITRLVSGGTSTDPSSTLMEQIVGEQTIPYRSPLYEAGKAQFRENMEYIISEARARGVHVIVGELVSNLRDQHPFISVDTDEEASAGRAFAHARTLESAGDFEHAKEEYQRARDLDALRFRAPGEFNAILRDLAGAYGIPCVPMESLFERNSEHGLIGSSLILEHLHPNAHGYFLLARGFFDTMREQQLIGTAWSTDGLAAVEHQGLTPLDSVYAGLVIRRLKGSWPFQPRSLPNQSLAGFQPSGKTEEVALHVMQHANFNLESGHMEMGEWYEKQGKPDSALAEYQALIASIPAEMEFYRKAANVLLAEKRYPEAAALLQQSLIYKETEFANQWIGQIALMNNDFKTAAAFLVKCDSRNAQVVFNLGRAYYLDHQIGKGEECYVRLQKLAPKSEYFAYLAKMRTMIMLEHHVPGVSRETRH